MTTEKRDDYEAMKHMLERAHIAFEVEKRGGRAPWLMLQTFPDVGEGITATFDAYTGDLLDLSPVCGVVDRNAI